MADIPYTVAGQATKILREIAPGQYADVVLLPNKIAIVSPAAPLTVLSAVGYTSGKIIAQSATAGSCSGIAVPVARAIDQSGLIRRLRLKSTDVSNLAGKTIRAHIFKDTPTFTNGDNGNFSGGLSESNWIGAIDVTFDQTFSDYVKGNGIPINGAELNFEPSSGTANVFLVYEARGSFTSGTSKTLTAAFEVWQG